MTVVRPIIHVLSHMTCERTRGNTARRPGQGCLPIFGDYMKEQVPSDTSTPNWLMRYVGEPRLISSLRCHVLPTSLGEHHHSLPVVGPSPAIDAGVRVRGVGLR